jgi:hypothetical protein
MIIAEKQKNFTFELESYGDQAPFVSRQRLVSHVNHRLGS